MQQPIRHLAIIFGGSLAAVIGLTLAACGTDNGTTPVPTANGDTGGSKKDAKGRDDDPDDEENDDEDPGAQKDAGTDCSEAPKLRSNSGVFCFGGDGSNKDGTCSKDESKICCSDAKDTAGTFIKASCAVAEEDTAGGYETGSCNFAPDAGGREWHCTEGKQCPGAGAACCVIKGTTGTPKALADKDFPGCGTFFNGDQGYNVGGTRCRAACEAGELTLCSSDAECPNDTTCHPIKLSGRYTGVCQ